MTRLVEIAAPRGPFSYLVRLLFLLVAMWLFYMFQEVLTDGVPPEGWYPHLRSFTLTALPFCIPILALVQHQRKLQERLTWLAHTDVLTGLPNRRAFVDQAGPEAARGDVLLLLDIDHFKRINDSFGHDAGDRVLMQVAQALRDHLRAGDLVARMGGEEFAVLLRNVSVAHAGDVAERIAKGISVSLPDCITEPIVLTLSVGLTERVNAQDLHEALRQADVALYRAKDSGRACSVVWSPQMMQSAD